MKMKEDTEEEGRRRKMKECGLWKMRKMNKDEGKLGKLRKMGKMKEDMEDEGN